MFAAVCLLLCLVSVVPGLAVLEAGGVEDPAEAAGVKAVLGALAESEAQWLAAVDRHPTKQSLVGRQSMMDMLCGAPLLCVCMAVFGGQADGQNAQKPKRVAHVSFPRRRAPAPRVQQALRFRQARASRPAVLASTCRPASVCHARHRAPAALAPPPTAPPALPTACIPIDPNK